MKKEEEVKYFYILKKCVQTYLPLIICSPRHGHNTCFTISMLILLRSALDANYVTSFATIRDLLISLLCRVCKQIISIFPSF